MTADEGRGVGIERHIHGVDIDFFSAEVYDTFGFSDVVRAGEFLHTSGVVPLHGSMTDLRVVCEGDFRGQYEWVLRMLRALLERSGARFPQDVVSVEVMTTDMHQVNANCDVFATAFAGHYPAAVYVGVAALFHPAQLVEVKATAYLSGS